MNKNEGQKEESLKWMNKKIWMDKINGRRMKFIKILYSSLLLNIKHKILVARYVVRCII
jgi:hypothetical protein